MFKYTLIAVIIALIIAVAGFGIWFFRLPGPHQLELADRWWPGSVEHSAPSELGLAYSKDDRQRLDIYRPDGSGSKPVIVFFHGGSWRDGDRASYAFVGRAFAARGFVTVIADYRKYPQVKFPDFVKDAAAATAWIHQNIASHGGDPDQLYLMGHSAGAHLIALVAADRKWLGGKGDMIKGVIGLAGPYDFYPFTNDAAKAALGGWPVPAETQPITYARGDAPPMLLLHGDSDETVKPRNSKVLTQAITDKGGTAQFKIYKDVDHADIIMAIARPFRSKAPVIDDTISFIKSTQP